MSSKQKAVPRASKVPNTSFVIVLLLLATALALSPVLLADFIRLDDYGHLFENPQLRRMSVAGLGELWTKSYFNLYIPITYSAWWALTMVGSLFGELRQNAWLFHTFNLAVHLVNTSTVFFLLRALIGRPSPSAPKGHTNNRVIAAICALFFALHPVQVESVAWVSELKGELAAFFGLLGLWSHYRANKRVVAGVLFVAAMLSKPSAIVLPGIVFLINRIIYRKTLAQSALHPLLYGVPLIALGIVTKQLQPNSEQDFIPTLVQRLVVAADAISFYASKVLAPFPLVLDYGRTPEFVLAQVSGTWVAFSGLFSAAVVAYLVLAVVQHGKFSKFEHAGALVHCGSAIFLVSLLPVLGLIPFGFQEISTVADHYLYISMFGFSVLIAGILVHFQRSSNARLVAVLALVACSALGFRQARLWHSTETLFRETIKVNPNSYIGSFCIGDELMRAGKLDEATEWLERSHAIKPSNLNAALTLGMVFTHNGDTGKALALYTSILAQNPSIAGTRAKYVASVHNNLGMLLLQSGQTEAAVEHLRKAVAIFPRSLNAHLNLGNVAYSDGRYTDAAAEYEIALSLSPGSRGIEQRLEAARQRAQQR